MIKGWIRKMNRLAILVAMTAFIGACGGGGGNDDNGSGFVPPPEPQGPDITVKLSNADGDAITEITPFDEGLFRVSVKAPNGDPLPQEVVSAEVTIGRLIPESGTALTDENGEAVFIVLADGIDGAGTLTATASYDGTESSGSVNYSVNTVLPFSLGSQIISSDNSVVTSVDTGDRITLRVTLTDNRTQEPIQYQIISADIGDLGTISPENGSALTNSEGEADFIIVVGDESGAFPINITTTVPGGAVSNTVNLTVGPAQRLLGHLDSSGNFVEGVIKVTPSGQLSPGGIAALSVVVVGADLEPVATQETLTLSSSCLFGDLASLTPESPVIMGSSITITYTVRGCAGEDVVTARLASSGAEASGVVDIGEAVAKRIVFSAASADVIALQGTGSASDLAESALVTFKVTDERGTAVPGQRVNFSLVQTVGGLALECNGSDFCRYENADDQSQGRSSQATSVSDAQGTVSTTVMSGNVATPVQVLAYVDLNDNGSQDLGEPASTSKSLVASTGLPDQNSISLSASVLNIEGAYEMDGKTSTLSVRMADKFNNPVPDGTQAVFSTELGSIVGSCNTTQGACSVDWTSQSPRGSDTVERYSSSITIFENLDASLPNRYKCASHRENHGPCPDDIGSPSVNAPRPSRRKIHHFGHRQWRGKLRRSECQRALRQR